MILENDFRIYVRDLQRLGYCVRSQLPGGGVTGQKEWFERHGFDFRAVIKEGVLASEFLEKGDGIAEIAVRRLLEARDGKK